MATTEQIVAAMERQFGDDRRRIAHAHSVLGWAERILAAEGGDAEVVVAAALLHDIGIQEAERKHGSSAGHYQEIEGPPIARGLLEELGVPEPTIEHVCRIVANHHSAKDIDTPEFRIIWDADWLVNLPDEFPDRSREERATLVGRIFKTEMGKRLAMETFG